MCSLLLAKFCQVKCFYIVNFNKILIKIMKKYTEKYNEKYTRILVLFAILLLFSAYFNKKIELLCIGLQ